MYVFDSTEIMAAERNREKNRSKKLSKRKSVAYHAIACERYLFDALYSSQYNAMPCYGMLQIRNLRRNDTRSRAKDTTTIGHAS